MNQIPPLSDRRFEVVRDRNSQTDISYMHRFRSLDQWLARRLHLKDQVVASAGLLPMPEKTPLNTRVVKTIDRGEYLIDSVYFESLPGFYVTGNLYRPAGSGPFPGILNPHGHWKEGRLENNETCSVPGRCINFARQGYVSFSLDMIGYNDSKQYTHATFDLRQRLWGISPGGLQLWNSIRSIDFLQSLPYVDPERIACTGASGGGTQTFLLCAVDDRVKVSAPVNMISAHMHGGCFCENPPGLRIDTDNVEIGAMMAPRPMLMVCATGDWTKNTPEVEFPAIRHIYSLFGAEDKLEYLQIDAGHNYNQASRQAVYSFFGKHLSPLGVSDSASRGSLKPLSQPVAEQTFGVEPEEDLRVFPGELPEGTPDMQTIVEQSIDTFRELIPMHRQERKRALALGLGVPQTMEVDAEVLSVETDVDISMKRMIIEEKIRGTRIPALVIEPTDEIVKKVAVVVDGPGGAFVQSGAVRKLVESGWRVISIDCFGNGAHTAPEGSPARDINEGFFDTYNRTDTSECVYDILTAIRWAETDASSIALIGSGLGGPWCLLAAPFADAVTDIVVDGCGLDLADDQALIDKLFVPCLQRAGGFETALSLCSSRRLMMHNTRDAAAAQPLQVVRWLCEG